ncbi:uncharacterized protein F4822DRAFT_320836 [Hypoxylon trugodes]|uniref:uncharacterized protein n=1 Tax=Hypoxylon trugodes TaxID=326681 RepID=UPI00218E2C92|nr:uncharacterized protein F4822DRAFT_320836 [Hypoxylon trugodes]KAI1386588.1 hypothetical protein F4822DRAFT_320836 [Hypoxylon trugodes]
MPPTRRQEPQSKGFRLKKIASTPNVREQGTNEADHGPSGLPNERRRNRLGYHRTPIACKHCRRRKIRCKQPEAPDVLGRCESCMSLNKDCIYTAVNQQPPPPATGHRQGAGTPTNLASPSTSPALPTGHSVEAQSNAPYQLTTIPSMPSNSMEAEEEEAYATEPRIPSNAPSDPTFSYGHDAGSWLPTGAGASTARMPGDSSTMWTSFAHGLPDGSDPSSYNSQHPTGSAGLGRINSTSRLDDGWRSYPPGTRSMSYSDDQSGRYDRQTSLATNAVPEAGLGIQDPLSAGAVPHATYGTWQQYQYSRPNEDYGGWYEDREQSPQTHALSAGQDPSQAGGMYYGGR